MFSGGGCTVFEQELDVRRPERALRIARIGSIPRDPALEVGGESREALCEGDRHIAPLLVADGA
jgi:hypothetical protein